MPRRKAAKVAPPDFQLRAHGQCDCCHILAQLDLVAGHNVCMVCEERIVQYSETLDKRFKRCEKFGREGNVITLELEAGIETWREELDERAFNKVARDERNLRLAAVDQVVIEALEKRDTEQSEIVRVRNQLNRMQADYDTMVKINRLVFSVSRLLIDHELRVKELMRLSGLGRETCHDLLRPRHGNKCGHSQFLLDEMYRTINGFKVRLAELETAVDALKDAQRDETTKDTHDTHADAQTGV